MYAYEWFQVSVGKLLSMHEADTLHDLKHDGLHVILAKWPGYSLQVMMQVAHWQVLHGYEESIVELEPAQSLYKASIVLVPIKPRG